MSRIMGDAIGANAGTIPKTVDLIAPYITGLFGVPWKPADLALFPNIPHATIDQGAGNAPRYDAVVMDIETGAWSISQVTNWMNNATNPRPTVYVNRGNEFDACLEALKSPNFKGDVWLAFPGWQEGQALPILPMGCKCVAVQNVFNNAYDLSTVLDDTWPNGKVVDPVSYPQFIHGYRTCTKCSGVYVEVNPGGYGNVCPAGGNHSSGFSGTTDTIILTIDGNTPAGS